MAQQFHIYLGVQSIINTFILSKQFIYANSYQHSTQIINLQDNQCMVVGGIATIHIGCSTYLQGKLKKRVYGKPLTNESTNYK